MTDSRDDANLKHFGARSQQPKVLAGGPGAASAAERGNTPVNIFIMYDHPFSTSDQIDNTRFKHIGTSSVANVYERMCDRRKQQSCMSEVFEY